MKKLIKMLTLALGLTGMVSSCSEEAININNDAANDFAQAFIEKYGVPQPGHNFSMAKSGNVTVRTNKPSDIRVVGSVNGKYYTFTEAFGVTGEKTLTFDIPRDVNYVSVISDNKDIATVALGGVASFDNRRNSRADETSKPLVITDANSTTMEYDLNGSASSVLSWNQFDENIFYVESKTGFPRNMYGTELIQYITDDRKAYEGYSNATYTANHIREHVHVMNLNVGVGQQLEFGRIYGNENNLDESTSFTLVPFMYCEGNEKRGTVHKRGYTKDLSCWGHDLTLDFANNNISSKILGFSNYQDFTNILNPTLENQLTAYAEAQATYNMPTPATSYAGGTIGDVTLDPYDHANPYIFYNQWNDYINAWINSQNAEVKAKFADLTAVKEFMAVHDLLFKEGAVASVTKNGDRSFTIEYFDSQNGSSLSSINANATETVKNNPGDTYYLGGSYEICLAEDKDNEDALGREFTYYIRDMANPYNIVTTKDKDKVKITNRHMSFTEAGDNNIYSDDKVYMVDFNNDGVYNDLVFIAENAEYGTGQYFGWRLAAEDLGNTLDSDFNDLVVDLRLQRYGNDAIKLSFTPRAAGGIYPLYLMLTDALGKTYFIGKELHSWLKSPVEIFNTGAEAIKNIPGVNSVSFDWDLYVQGKEFSLSNGQITKDGKLSGLWVLVDKDNKLEGKITDDKFTLMTNEIKTLIDDDDEIYTVNNHVIPGTDSMVPQLILMTNEWQWPQETKNIGDAYGKFSEWVKDQTVKWYGPGAEGVKTELLSVEK